MLLHKIVNGAIDCPDLLTLLEFRAPQAKLSQDMFCRRALPSFYIQHSVIPWLMREGNEPFRNVDFFGSSFQPFRRSVLRIMCSANPLIKNLLERSRPTPNEGDEAHSLPSVQDIIEFLDTESSCIEDSNLQSTPHENKVPYSWPKLLSSRKVHFSHKDVTMLVTSTQLSFRNTDPW
ncbi:hypothetical protein J6590_082324 [Homalodisca vitripennis]|nr:hypothetical protein J6590_082324 [Homalodisca vitripennis]